MSLTEHPLTNFFDAVAVGGRPSETDVDAMVARCCDDLSASDLNAEQLRRELIRWSRKIMIQRDDGNAGQARTYAREATATLAAALGPDLPPAPDRNAGKTMAEIIASIPRSGI